MRPKEFRIAIRTDDFDAVSRLYREVFELEQIADWSGEAGSGVLLSIPHATLEILSTEHSDHVDSIEANDVRSSKIRFALSVDSVEKVSAAVCSSDVYSEAASPVVPPWGGKNLRLRSTEEPHLTLFEEPLSGESPA